GVVRLGKAHRRREWCALAVLGEAPRGAEVPPLRTVEQEVEAGTGELDRVLKRTAERLGEEEYPGMGGFGTGDQERPELGRDFVRGVAAKAVEAERRVGLGEPQPEPPERVSVAARGVVDLGEVAPHHPAFAVPGARVDGLPRLVALV